MSERLTTSRCQSLSSSVGSRRGVSVGLTHIVEHVRHDESRESYCPDGISALEELVSCRGSMLMTRSSSLLIRGDGNEQWPGARR